MKTSCFVLCLSFLSIIKSELFCERLIANHETEDSLIEVMNQNIKTYSNDLG